MCHKHLESKCAALNKRLPTLGPKELSIPIGYTTLGYTVLKTVAGDGAQKLFCLWRKISLLSPGAKSIPTVYQRNGRFYDEIDDSWATLIGMIPTQSWGQIFLHQTEQLRKTDETTESG